MAPRVSSGTPLWRPTAEIELDHGFGAREHGVDVAIALAHDGRLGVASRRELAGLGIGIEQHRQFGDVDGDEVGGVLRDVGIGGEHRRDGLADIAHAVGREHRLAVRLQPLDAAFAEIDRRHVGDIGGGPYRDDARQRPRRRGVDGDDPAMGDLRAGEPHVKLVRKRDVAGKAPAPRHQRRVFEPRHRLADIFVGCDLGGVDLVDGDFHGCATTVDSLSAGRRSDAEYVATRIMTQTKRPVPARGG